MTNNQKKKKIWKKENPDNREKTKTEEKIVCKRKEASILL